MLAKRIENVSFVYCRRLVNELADRIAKETSVIVPKKVVVNEFFWLPKTEILKLKS